jgi:NADPH-dependent ferric siderophore reductase
MSVLVLRDSEKGRKPARPTDEEVNLDAVAKFMRRFGIECRVVEFVKDDVDGMRQCVVCMDMHPVKDFTRKTNRRRLADVKVPGKKHSSRVYTVRVCPDCMKNSGWNRGRHIGAQK